jgi:hypothetical protein
MLIFDFFFTELKNKRLKHNKFIKENPIKQN